MEKLSYRERANSAERLKGILNKDKPNYISKNLTALMLSDLPDDEKDYLSEVLESRDEDLLDQIEEYEQEYLRSMEDGESGESTEGSLEMGE